MQVSFYRNGRPGYGANLPDKNKLLDKKHFWKIILTARVSWQNNTGLRLKSKEKHQIHLYSEINLQKFRQIWVSNKRRENLLEKNGQKLIQILYKIGTPTFYQPLLVIREMESRIIRKYHYIPTRLANVKWEEGTVFNWYITFKDSLALHSVRMKTRVS